MAGPAEGKSVKFTVTDDDGALSGTLSTEVFFLPLESSKAITLTAAENTTQDDGAHDVTFALQLNDDSPYTLGTAPAVTSVTITVRDDDTPPLAVRNLTAQAGDTEATLRWQLPAANTPDHGQPVLYYEYRVKTTGGFGSWTRFPNSDADTRSHTFTSLPNDQEHTYQVRAVNVAGGGASIEKSVTPIVGIAVSFGAATLSVDEGGTATVTLTLALAPALGTTGDGADRGDAGPGTRCERVFGGAVAGDLHHGGRELHGGDGGRHRRRAGPAADVLVRPRRCRRATFRGTNSQLVLTLVDDDVPIVSATFGRATAEVQEGTSVPVTVRLSQAPEREVVLSIVATRGAGLTAGEHEAVPASVTFTEDETEKSFAVTFADDAVEEGNETLTLTFGTYPDRVQAGTNTRLTLTVTDDDGPPLAPARVGTDRRRVRGAVLAAGAKRQPGDALRGALAGERRRDVQRLAAGGSRDELPGGGADQRQGPRVRGARGERARQRRGGLGAGNAVGADHGDPDGAAAPVGEGDRQRSRGAEVGASPRTAPTRWLRTRTRGCRRSRATASRCAARRATTRRTGTRWWRTRASSSTGTPTRCWRRA